MSSPCWRRSLHIFMLVCLRLTNAATESRPTTEQTPSGTPTTDGGTFNQTSPAPWGPTTPAPLGLTTKDQSGFDPTSSSTTEGTNGDSNFTATTNRTDSEALVTVQTPTEPTSPTSVPVVLPDGKTEGTCCVLTSQAPSLFFPGRNSSLPSPFSVPL